MINPKNSLTLALTKLKVRKLRTIITIIIASLTFSVLIFAMMIFDGFFLQSLHNFSKQTLSSKNILKGTGQNYYYSKQGIDKNDLKTLDEMLDQEIASRSKRAKELGLEFDSKQARQILKPYYHVDKDIIEPNYQSKVYQKFSSAKIAKSNQAKHQQVQQFAKDTKAVRIDFGAMLRQKNSNYFVKQDNKYNFVSEEDTRSLNYDIGPISPGSNSKSAITLDNITLAPQPIYQPFYLKNHSWQEGSNSIPIILAANKVESLLNLKPLPKGSKPEVSVKRLKEIQDGSKGLKFSVCYLNNLAMQNHQAALTYQKMKPEEQNAVSLAYAPLDSTKCATPAIIKDRRSNFEKNYTKNTQQFAYEFEGSPLVATATEIQFEVVGVLPYQTFDSEFIDFALRSLSGQIQTSNFVPLDLLLKSSALNDFKSFYTDFALDSNQNLLANLSESEIDYYLEYETPKQAKSILDKRECLIYGIHSPVKCENTPHLQVYFESFGSRSADLIGIQEEFVKYIKIITVIAVIFATIIMMGTVGRVISDSRRETAVFRAIGFKRFDISAVYLCYSFLLSLAIAVFSFVLSLIAASSLNSIASEDLTARAIWIYHLKDHSLKFNLVGLNFDLIFPIILVIILTGIISTALPLLRNIRRNPIKDMRDE